MGGVTGDSKQLRELIGKFEQLATPKVRKDLVNNLAEEYTSFAKGCFAASQSPYGQPWAPLHKTTRESAEGEASQKPLMNTGLMNMAITPTNITADGFLVSVSRSYASVHQFGAKIVPRNAKVLVWGGKKFTGFSKKGKKLKSPKVETTGPFFAKSVTIPARPYLPLDGWPSDLKDRLMETASEFLEKHFEDL